MPINPSSKKLQIDKANVQIVIAISVAVFFAIFALVGTKTMVSQLRYQSKLISKKQVAKDTLENNLKNTDQLVKSYQTFVSEPANAIGGSSTGTGDKDGDNARIVLDALPSKYDYPALATSIQKILTQPGSVVDSITGTDDEVNQAANQKSANPQPVDMPFEAAVTTDYKTLSNILLTLERSIRPIQLQSLSITATDKSIKLSFKANTYYQPEKILDIKKEVVK